MTYSSATRTWRVFIAQCIGLPIAGVAAAALVPSWWAIVPIPAALLLPALDGAGRDWMEQRRRDRAYGRALAIRVHPSTWDSYFEIGEREWPLR